MVWACPLTEPPSAWLTQFWLQFNGIRVKSLASIAISKLGTSFAWSPHLRLWERAPGGRVRPRDPLWVQ
jgi:hypothetical protein